MFLFFLSFFFPEHELIIAASDNKGRKLSSLLPPAKREVNLTIVSAFEMQDSLFRLGTK